MSFEYHHGAHCRANDERVRELEELYRSRPCAECAGFESEVERLSRMYGKTFSVARELMQDDTYMLFVREMDQFREDISK